MYYRLLLLTFCTSLFMTAGAQSKRQRDTICIIQLNDIYEISPLDAGKTAGLARVATVIKEARAHYTTFALLAGDFLSPSAFGTAPYEGERLNGRHMVDVMNTAGIDYVTFGNHEFDIPQKSLQKRIDESQFGWISSNVFMKDSTVKPFYKNVTGEKIDFPRTIVLTSPNNQFRIGLFSVTLPANLQNYIYYMNADSAVQEVLPGLHKESDLIFGFTHLSYREDSLLLAKHRDIRFIMGGHEHQQLYVKSGSGAVAKADANARTIYKYLIWKKRKKFRIKSELIRLDESVAKDSLTDARVHYWEDVAYKAFRTSGLEPTAFVCNMKDTLHGMESAIRFGQNNMGDAITSAMLMGNTADAAVINSGSIRIDDNVTGTITEMDIIRVLPFGGQVINVTMKGSLLLKLMSANDDRKGFGGYLQYGTAISREGENWKEKNMWNVKGKPVDPAANYTIAMIEFLASGREQMLDYFNTKNPEIIKVDKVTDAAGAGLDIRRMLIDYLKK